MNKKHLYWYELPKERWAEKHWSDSQKTKLYRSEHRFRLQFWRDTGEPKFGSIEEAQKYVDKLLASAWITKRWGKQESVTVIHRERKSCTAYKWDRIIKLSKWGWCPVVVLHELAHILHPSYYGRPHGRYFARTLLELITWQFGNDARKILKSLFKSSKVKTNPFPNYSDEVLQKKRERGKELAATYLKKTACAESC